MRDFDPTAKQRDFRHRAHRKAMDDVEHDRKA